MTKVLGIFALLSLIISVSSAIIAIWFQLTPKDDLLQLVEKLLSWEIIAGGLIIGAGHTFKNEIKKLFER